MPSRIENASQEMTARSALIISSIDSVKAPRGQRRTPDIAAEQAHGELRVHHEDLGDVDGGRDDVDLELGRGDLVGENGDRGAVIEKHRAARLDELHRGHRDQALGLDVLLLADGQILFRGPDRADRGPAIAALDDALLLERQQIAADGGGGPRQAGPDAAVGRPAERLRASARRRMRSIFPVVRFSRLRERAGTAKAGHWR